MYSIPSLLSAMVAGAFGGFVLLREWRQWPARLLAGGLLALAVMECATGACIALMRYEWLPFWCELTMTSVALVSSVWLPLSLIIGRRDASALLRQAAWYLVPVCLMGLGGFLIVFVPTWGILEDYTAGRNAPYIGINRYGRILCLFALGCTLAILMNFEGTWRSAENSARRRVKYALLGLIGAFIFQGYVLTVALLFRGIDASLLAARSVAFLLAVLLLARAVIRERLLNVDIYVGREVAYTSFTLLGAGIYLVAIGLLFKALQVAHVQLNLFVMSAGVFLLLFLLGVGLTNEAVRRRLRVFVDRNFYAHKHDYRAQWERFSARTSGVLEREAAAERIVDFVGEVFYADKVALLLTDRDARRVALCMTRDARGNKERFKSSARLSASLRDWLRHGELSWQVGWRNVPALFDEVASLIPQPSAFVPVLCVPLRVEDAALGLIAVGKKQVEKGYDREDLDLLTTLSRQIAVNLLNVQLAEELATAKEMESFHKLTSFVLHDVKNCISMLSLLMQNAERNFHNPEFQRDALSTIRSTVSKMQGLIQRLAETRTLGQMTVQASAQPVNLRQVVEDCVERVRASLAPSIRLESCVNGVPEIRGDAELLQKVMTNLLLNAIEAVGSEGDIVVRSDHSPEGVKIIVSDNGCGMSPEFVERYLFQPFASTKSKGLGIGL
ncbi:MAG: PEP-CTERM system histidine kinase PrsK, partial [Abditibacteriales bacterium]|nr:PEP-CTERM system histidine kinase PrsK [Abditibacteriales bacterium]MDW8368266.1 PEP-CTERM system histidine kinase PrsK [Abditibacteriales bacterium]